MTVSLRRNRVELNTVTPDMASTLFSRGNLVVAEEVDLARLQMPTDVRRPTGTETPAVAERPVGLGMDEEVQRVRGAQLLGEIEPTAERRLAQ